MLKGSWVWTLRRFKLPIEARHRSCNRFEKGGSYTEVQLGRCNEYGAALSNDLRPQPLPSRHFHPRNIVDHSTGRIQLDPPLFCSFL